MAKDKIYSTPNGFFKVKSKSELVDFFKERYPDVKQKEILLVEEEPEDHVFDLQELILREFRFKQKMEQIDLCFKGITPTRTFVVGERVMYGRFDKMRVTEIHENNLLYTISDGESVRFVTWIEIQKFRTEEENNSLQVLHEKNPLHLNFGNASIDSLLTKVYHFGVNMDPPYQRGLEWTLEDKVLLIDSIFKDLDIGKFVFVHEDFKENEPGYSIMDGKQRLSTIKEFYEDRFAYKGKKFSELNLRDQRFFENKGISFATIEGKNLDEKTIVKYFLRLNQGGVAVDKKHLQTIAEKYELKEF